MRGKPHVKTIMQGDRNSNPCPDFHRKRIVMEQLSENNGNKMKCIECGGHMRLRQISGYMQTKTVVDAFVCDNCGEIVFPSASAKILEQALDCKSKM